MRWLLCASLVMLVGAVAEGAEKATRPNVVFILADDLGWSDLGCYGGEIETPNLDRLAAQGLRFTQFYNTARCWPSRASLLTGYYAQEVNRDPSGERPNWAALAPEFLRAAGYTSYHSGKWHVDGDVLAGGFTRSYLISDSNRFFNPNKQSIDDKPIDEKPPADYYATTAAATHAINFLNEHDRERKGEPFFLYLAFISPHFPLHAPQEDIDRYRDRYVDGWDAMRARRWERIQKLGLLAGTLSNPEADVVPAWNLKEDQLTARIGPGEVGRAVPWSSLTSEQQKFQAAKMAIHAAMVDRMDREIGRVLEQIKQMGAADNTLVMFASDNGASGEQIIRGDGHSTTAPMGSGETFLGLGPGWSTVANTPFRKHKSWTHEGGISTPLVVSWPAGIKARGELRHAPGHFVDVLPTMLELAGAPVPSTWKDEPRPPLPGRSLAPIFAADTREPHAPLFFKHTVHRGLRVGDWKIVASDNAEQWELYDLAHDRTETCNLATENPSKTAELAAIWTELDARYAKEGASGGVQKVKNYGKKSKRKDDD
jgi:arylsulfatase